MSAQDNPFGGVGAGLSNADDRLIETFGWYTVAKKEFRDAVRSKGLWVLTLVFISIFIVPVALALYLDINFVTRGGQALGMELLISGLYLNIVTVMMPIIAIFVGYASISKERTSGSLKLLLSLPNSRRDVIIGKVLGRCAVVCVPLVIALSLGALFFAISSITLKPTLYAQFSLFTIVFAAVFVSIAVSISGAFASSIASAIANFALYMYLTFGWNFFVNGFGDILSNNLGIQGSGRWHLVLIAKLLNPNQAYKTLVNSILGSGDSPALAARFGMFSQGGLFSSGLPSESLNTICGDVLGGSPAVQRSQFGEQIVCESGTGVVGYFSDPAVLLFMLVWIGVAAAVSYYTFNLADL